MKLMPDELWKRHSKAIEGPSGTLLVNPDYSANGSDWWRYSGAVQPTSPTRHDFSAGTMAGSGFHGSGVMMDGTRWTRCPFCRQRQDIKADGPTCNHCGGDLLAEGVIS